MTAGWWTTVIVDHGRCSVSCMSRGKLSTTAPPLFYTTAWQSALNPHWRRARLIVAVSLMMQPSPALRELKTISGHSSFCSMADGYPEGHELKHAFAWMPSALCRLYTVKSDIRSSRISATLSHLVGIISTQNSLCLYSLCKFETSKIKVSSKIAYCSIIIFMWSSLW